MRPSIGTIGQKLHRVRRHVGWYSHPPSVSASLEEASHHRQRVLRKMLEDASAWTIGKGPRLHPTELLTMIDVLHPLPTSPSAAGRTGLRAGFVTGVGAGRAERGAARHASLSPMAATVGSRSSMAMADTWVGTSADLRASTAPGHDRHRRRRDRLPSPAFALGGDGERLGTAPAGLPHARSVPLLPELGFNARWLEPLGHDSLALPQL